MVSAAEYVKGLANGRRRTNPGYVHQGTPAASPRARRSLLDPNYNPNSNVSKIPFGGAIPSAGIPAMPNARGIQGALAYGAQLRAANDDPNAPTPLMDNNTAAAFYQANGYMPNITVGGAFGRRKPTPDAMIRQGRRNSAIDYLRDPIGYEKTMLLSSVPQSAPASVVRPPAGGRPREEILEEMQRAGKGYFDQQTGAFIGAAPAMRGKEGTPSPSAAALVGNPAALRSAQVGGSVGPPQGGSPNPLSAARAERARTARDMITRRASQSAEQRRLRMEGPTWEQRLAMADPAAAQRGPLERENMASRERVAGLNATATVDAARAKGDATAEGYRMALAGQYLAAGKPIPPQLLQGSSAAGMIAGPNGPGNSPMAPDANDPTSPIFYGGVVSAEQKEVLDSLEPDEAARYLKSQGKSDEEVTRAVQEMYGNPLFGMAGKRTAKNPGFWSSILGRGAPPLAFPKNYTPEQERRARQRTSFWGGLMAPVAPPTGMGGYTGG